jgi:hypothetical protein
LASGLEPASAPKLMRLRLRNTANDFLQKNK